jgi:hypothetical protein
MVNPNLPPEESPGPIELAAILPGPGRKRGNSPYVYRLKYLNANLKEAGCAMIWEVQGGRLTYQIAVERQENGQLRGHCTCADAVYRAETEGRVCKHVRAFLAFANPSEPPAGEEPPPLRRGA